MIKRFARTTTVLLAVAVSTAACAQAGSIRPGHPTPEVTEVINLDIKDRWIMTTGEKGVDPTVVHITSEPMHRSIYRRFETLIEIELPEDRRQQVRDNLQEGHHSQVQITDRGVSYVVESKTDLEMRSLSEVAGYETTYEPHDCSRVIGACAYTVNKPFGDVRHYIRTSSFKDGIWNDRVNYDPARDPEGRSDLVEESIFSVDATGLTMDLERTEFRDGKTFVTRMNHVESITAEEIVRPAVPDGSYGALGSSCHKGHAIVSMASGDLRINDGGRAALPVDAETQVILKCGTTTQTDTTCSRAGHLRVLLREGWMAVGCYEGPIPADPWAES